MAAIDSNTGRSATLHALTAAALLLPGVQPAFGQSTSPSASVQVSRYVEDSRSTSVPTGRTPLEAWTLDFNATAPVLETLRLDVGLMQDTWSGATPVTTAPLAFGGNRPQPGAALNAMSSASPIINGSLLLDRNLQPLSRNTNGTTSVVKGNELVMSSASPEIRQQADIALQQDSGRWRSGVRFHYSTEPDYHSRRLMLRSELDFNQQLTTAAIEVGASRDDITGHLAGDWLPYLTTTVYSDALERDGAATRLKGEQNSKDIAFALTQVLSRTALLDLGFRYEHSDGYMGNPYRAMTVIFVDPVSLNAPGQAPVMGDVRALLEQRPHERTTRAATLHYVQHVPLFDAALHFNYDYSTSDWEVESHAAEVQWIQPLGNWTLSSRVRWYTQSGAWFHDDYLITHQRYRGFAKDELGREIWLAGNDPAKRYFRTTDGRYFDTAGRETDATLLDLQPQFTAFSATLLPTSFSSDPRLAGYGVVSAGIGLQYRFDNGLMLEASVDQYRRASSLQAGGHGDSSYADFDYATASIALTMDWQTVQRRRRQSANHADHAAHAHLAPAGMMMVHGSSAAGTLMTGYRAHHQPDMTMHMLDFTYYPSERVSLMVMPQFMTMDPHATSHRHGTGTTTDSESNFADTLIAASWHPITNSGEWQLMAGVGIPGSGDGTSDLMPAVTYQTNAGSWHWGARAAMTAHLETQHQSDRDPARSSDFSMWFSRPVTTAISASLRAQHQSSSFKGIGTGRSAGLGLGLSAELGAQQLSLEWMEVVEQRGVINGHLHEDSLYATWHLNF